MKPPIEYRPRKGMIVREIEYDPDVIGLSNEDAIALLRHKRKLKACQMRRYRAKKASIFPS